MERKLQNRIFLLVFLFVVSITLVVKIVAFLGIDLSDVVKDRSYLEGREYNNFPKLTLGTIQSTEFQDDFEQFIADSLPFKDDAMLLNAGVQRSLISVSNLLFDFDVYPTFYGSDYVYDAENDSLYETLSTTSVDLEDTYKNAAEAFNDFSDRFSNLDILFYRMDRLSASDENPTNQYISNPVNSEFLTENFFNYLDSNINVINGYDDKSAFYKTDHHWNIAAAYQAYESILNYLMPQAKSVEYTEIEYKEPSFHGSLTRSGLCLVESPDFIKDYYIDMSGFSVSIDGKDCSSSVLDNAEDYSEDVWNSDAFTNRYAEYFHADYGFIEIHNSIISNGESLLIVGDSFSNSMERFFAANYENVYVYDARYADMGLDDIVNSYNVSDIVFIIGSTNYATEATLKALNE